MNKTLLIFLVLISIANHSYSQWATQSNVNNIVSNSTVDEFYPKVILDGTGGHIIAWTERISGNYNVYAQKLNNLGQRQWGNNGIVVCSNAGNQVLAGLTTDGQGGAIIVWEDSTGGASGYGFNDIYAQRVNSTGVLEWNANGVAICTAADFQGYINLISDNAGGAIISWQDYRLGGYLFSDIYVQRINGTGTVLWGSNGKNICNVGNPQVRPRICSDGGNGAWVVWEDYRPFSNSEIYYQKLDANGTGMLLTNGQIACVANFDQMFPEIISDNQGGALLSWYDKRTNGNSGVGDIYAQRVSSTGVNQWGTSGVLVCNATGDQFSSFLNLPTMIATDNQGFFICWNDLRAGNYDVYVQKMNSNGTPAWNANGLAIVSNTFTEIYPSICSDGSGGIYVVWDRYSAGQIDVYGQHVSSTGTFLFPTAGIPVGNASNSQYNNQIVANPDGTAVAVWNDKRANTNFKIYAQKIFQFGLSGCTPPTVSISSTLNTVCSGQAVTLTGNGANTYVWSNAATTGSITVNPVATTTYTVTGTNASGCTATATKTINVNTLPAVNSTVLPSSTVCAGSTITLSGTGANTYTWSGTVVNGVPFTINSTTTYTVTGVDNNGCSNTSTRLISVLTLPTLGTLALPSSTVCEGAMVNLSASGASSYSWTGGITNGVSFAAMATTIYTVTGTAVNGCTNTTTRLITVNPSPLINVVAQPGNTICAGTPLTLTASGGNTYSWSNGILNGQVFTPTVSSNYTVSVTGANGCSSTLVHPIIVNPLPVVNVSMVPSNQQVCQGESVTLSGIGAQSYVWSNSITDGVSFIPQNSASYTVTGTDANGCSNTASQLVTVNPLPVLNVTVSSGPVVCEGDEVTFTTSGALMYNWSNGIFEGVAFIPPASNSYMVTGVDINGCSNTAVQSVTVNTLPAVTITANPSASICLGDNVTLTGAGANLYNWTGGITDGIPFAPNVSNTYTVTGVDINGCSNTAVQLVTVNTLPIVSITANPSTSICSGENITLTGSGANLYNWTGGITDGVPFTPAGTNTYTVTGIDANGCSNTAAETVFVNPCNAQLAIKAFIEGYYLGGGMMQPVLLNQLESTDPLVCDSITIGLMDPLSSTSPIFEISTVLDVTGVTQVSLPISLVGNSYYIRLKHRNTLETWSANPVLINGNVSYDFTIDASQAYAANQVLVDQGLNLYAIYSGDINQDYSIDALDYLILDVGILNGDSGFNPSDLNGDGSVDALDYILLDPNIQLGVGASQP